MVLDLALAQRLLPVLIGKWILTKLEKFIRSLPENEWWVVAGRSNSTSHKWKDQFLKLNQ